MKTVVIKFGGTSLDTKEKRECACKIVKDKLSSGLFPVIIVSAMGRDGDHYSTDTLGKLVDEDQIEIKDFVLTCGEMISAGVLASELEHRGVNAFPLTGWQAGIIVEKKRECAEITAVNDIKIRDLINRHIIPVICGFQGITQDGNLKTLSRGGSEITAAFICKALDADRLEIFKDVEGIYSADPSKVKDADIIRHVSYEEIAEITGNGAKVINNQAAEFAALNHLTVAIGSTITGKTGTLIKDFEPQRLITAVTSKPDLTLFTIKVNQEFQLTEIFELLAINNVSIDFISVTNQQISFVVENILTEKAIDLANSLTKDYTTIRGLSKITVTGNGMTGQPGVMARTITALSKEKIDIKLATDSYSTISVLINKEKEIKALELLHREFIQQED